ncbi:hypothetical protein DNTS_013675 [Danionella cerebrum]|uniref:PH domain-containing protein n=1 Tax=Danionella cerebrum TaxID=2873325 RepID=A0A553N4L2_9TELE|nr:hypothetical protein DNTS_013675 [Danionella translucida]
MFSETEGIIFRLSQTAFLCSSSSKMAADNFADHNYTYYIHGAEDTVCSGYLYKSPPENYSKNQKSWKRRFFILLRHSNNKYLLNYYKSEENNKPLGHIDLSNVTLMFLNPEMHSLWKWIHNNFRCSSSCVLFLKVPDRDYFLIGENRLTNVNYTSIPQMFGLMKQISDPPQSANDVEQGARWSQPRCDAPEQPLPMVHEPVYVSAAPALKCKGKYATKEKYN